MRTCDANRRCPKGFFLVPADKTLWSLANKVDSFFEIYTRSVDLFFVCRMFFEDLKDCRTEEDANDLIGRRSSPTFDHEFAEPLTIGLPKVMDVAILIGHRLRHCRHRCQTVTLLSQNAR